MVNAYLLTPKTFAKLGTNTDGNCHPIMPYYKSRHSGNDMRNKVIIAVTVVIGIAVVNGISEQRYRASIAKYEGMTRQQIENELIREDARKPHNPIPAIIMVFLIAGLIDSLVDRDTLPFIGEMLQRQRDNDWRDGNG